MLSLIEYSMLAGAIYFQSLC